MNAFISASDQIAKVSVILNVALPCRASSGPACSPLLSVQHCTLPGTAIRCCGWQPALSAPAPHAVPCLLFLDRGRRNSRSGLHQPFGNVARPRLSSRLFECGIGARCKDAAYIENRRISLATCNWLCKDKVSRAGTQASCGMMQGATVAMLPRQS